ncbi:hypothetical protein JIR23_27925 [Bradyrhizobium diazoefficiens]|nr:hypothetical protein [Bradyrhizobium diazoefficiens]QQN63311.1 hypothetical protein JIR23_27925 [Bradyrhizobium diazoefficiens]
MSVAKTRKPGPICGFMNHLNLVSKLVFIKTAAAHFRDLLWQNPPKAKLEDHLKKRGCGIASVSYLDCIAELPCSHHTAHRERFAIVLARPLENGCTAPQ